MASPTLALPMRLALLALPALAMACGARTDLGLDERASPAPEVDAGTLPDGGTPPPPPLDAGVDAGSPDAGTDAGTDAGPRPCRVPAPVDLLLVIDDSGSMREEQLNLADNLPRLVSELVDPPDADGDGRPDWRAPRDLHLGVVTTGLDVFGGDDGVLRAESAGESCRDDYPRFLEFARGDDVAAVSEDFACLALAGLEGPGLEQPLEAALKALLPADAPVEVVGERPHGDRENAGFLRDDSLLSVVVLTDEDDCSTFDPVALAEGPFDPRELPPCLREGDPLYAIDRYEDAFRSLRPDRPDLFSFSVIAGVPERIVEDPENPDFERILSHPRMQYRIDPESRIGVVEACRGRGGSGFPARRLVQLAERFGDQSVVESICRTSYRGVVGAIVRDVGLRACEEFE